MSNNITNKLFKKQPQLLTVWKHLVLGTGVVLFGTMASPSESLAARITNDLFDLSQGTQIIDSSSGKIPIDSITNMFGDNLIAPNGDYRTLFDDSGSAGRTHFVEFKTPNPVILESFSLILLRDGEGIFGNRRGADAFRLFAFNDVSEEFDILLFEQTGLGTLYGSVTSPEVPPSPFSYPFLELRIDNNVTEFETNLFRAEFEQLTNLGPAVYSLDGFGKIASSESVPEPSFIFSLITMTAFGVLCIRQQK